MHERVLPAIACLTVLAACAGVPPALETRLNVEDRIALHGYDPVAYFSLGEPTPGLPEHSATWRGASYRFASAAHRAAFLEAPERYEPQYGGYCAIAMAWNRIADVDPHQWAIVDDRLYLNNSGFAHLLWSLRRSGHIRAADRNWRALTGDWDSVQGESDVGGRGSR